MQFRSLNIEIYSDFRKIRWRICIHGIIKESVNMFLCILSLISLEKWGAQMNIMPYIYWTQFQALMLTFFILNSTEHEILTC